MRVLLLNPPHKFKISRDSRWPEATKSDTFYYPFWLSYSAGILLENNHEALLIDAIAKELSFDEAIREIKEFKTELLVMETVTPTVLSDIRFLEKLKGEFPKIKTALVGTHVSALPEETLKLSNSIDFIARHEYENLWREKRRFEES